VKNEKVYGFVDDFVGGSLVNNMYTAS